MNYEGTIEEIQDKIRLQADPLSTDQIERLPAAIERLRRL